MWFWNGIFYSSTTIDFNNNMKISFELQNQKYIISCVNDLQILTDHDLFSCKIMLYNILRTLGSYGGNWKYDKISNVSLYLIYPSMHEMELNFLMHFKVQNIWTHQKL